MYGYLTDISCLVIFNILENGTNGFYKLNAGERWRQ